MPITQIEKELAAVGISIAAGCKPCTDFHVKAAMEAGAEEAAIRQAVDQAASLRVAAAGVMHAYGLARLGDHTPVPQTPVEVDRQAVLTGLGGAVAVNCTSSLERYIAAAEVAGVGTEEVSEIARLARFVKGKAASHVDRRIEALEKAVEHQPATACCDA